MADLSTRVTELENNHVEQFKVVFPAIRELMTKSAGEHSARDANWISRRAPLATAEQTL